MTDGGIGNGLSYWATINVKGDLTKEELNAVISQIRELLAGKVKGKSITGELVHATRSSNTTPPQLSVSANKARKTP